MKLLFRVSFVIGLVLFGFVLWSTDLERAWEIVSGANILLMIAGMAMTAPEALFKSLKLRSLARSQTSCSLVDALVVYFVGIPFGAVTPGKGGDMIKVYSLHRRTGIGLPEGFAVWVLDRLLDLLALVFFGSLGVLLLLTNNAGLSVLTWLVVPGFIGVIALVLFTQRRFVTRLAKPGLAVLSVFDTPGSPVSRLRQAFGAFYAGLGMARRARREIAMAAWFALGAAVAISTRSYVLSIALGLNVAWINFVLLVPLVLLIELLPITILGLGTREYAAIGIFAFLGIGREQAVSLSLSAFVLGLAPLVAVGYLVAVKEHLRPAEVREAQVAELDGR